MNYFIALKGFHNAEAMKRKLDFFRTERVAAFTPLETGGQIQQQQNFHEAINMLVRGVLEMQMGETMTDSLQILKMK